MKTKYDQQAENFLADNSIKFRCTLSDTKTPAWKKDGEKCGHHYRVTLSKAERTISETPNSIVRGVIAIERTVEPSKRLTFDYWGSIADAEKGEHPTAYDVLSCISGDVNCPDTFKDFCGEYGYEQDSIKALQLFRRCSSFAKRLQAFFTAQEIEQLQEIQ